MTEMYGPYELPAPIINLWCDAMMSGRYSQAVGAERMSDRRCAIGVLRDELGLYKTLDNGDSDGPLMEAVGAVSTRQVYEAGRVPSLVAAFNDSGHGFRWLAGWIRRNVAPVPAEGANIGEPKREFEEPAYDVPVEWPAPVETPSPEKEPVPV